MEESLLKLTKEAARQSNYSDFKRKASAAERIASERKQGNHRLTMTVNCVRGAVCQQLLSLSLFDFW